MQMKKRGSEGRFPRETISGVSPLWSRAKIFRILAGAACVSLALAACGGHNGSDSTSSGTPSSEAPQSLEATAALAAKSTTIPLAMSLKMNPSSIASDTQTDRFIVKYKTGTAERGATSAVQPRLDKLAGAFPSKAHHLRRMGVGSDVITTERKLNAKENGDMRYYQLNVPAGVKGVIVTLKPSNAKEAAWLFTRAGTPSVLHAECQAGMGNNNTATCTIANPAAGTYYLIVGAQSKVSSTLTATYTK